MDCLICLETVDADMCSVIAPVGCGCQFAVCKVCLGDSAYQRFVSENANFCLYCRGQYHIADASSTVTRSAPLGVEPTTSHRRTLCCEAVNLGAGASFIVSVNALCLYFVYGMWQNQVPSTVVTLYTSLLFAMLLLWSYTMAVSFLHKCNAFRRSYVHTRSLQTTSQLVVLQNQVV